LVVAFFSAFPAWICFNSSADAMASVYKDDGGVVFGAPAVSLDASLCAHDSLRSNTSTNIYKLCINRVCDDSFSILALVVLPCGALSLPDELLYCPPSSASQGGFQHIYLQIALVKHTTNFIMKTHRPFPSMPSKNLPGLKMQRTHISPANTSSLGTMPEILRSHLSTETIPDHTGFLKRNVFVESVGKHIVRHIVTQIPNKQTKPCCK